MDQDFWKERWTNNEIAFHLSYVNTLLVENFDALDLEPGSRIMVPLCGKTLDIAWLLASGYCVVGVELVQTAIDQLFEELGVVPKIHDQGNVIHYQAQNLDIFVGDIFNVTAEMLGMVDAIYDRAALIALPEAMRESYTKHLVEISNTAPQLLICIEYDQELMEGPPFSIDAELVNQYYSGFYNIKLLSSGEFAGALKTSHVKEHAWLLKPR